MTRRHPLTREVNDLNSQLDLQDPKDNSVSRVEQPMTQQVDIDSMDAQESVKSHSPETSPMVRLTFLGPPGTYSHQVALKLYPAATLGELSRRIPAGERGVHESTRHDDAGLVCEGDTKDLIVVTPCATITSTLQEAVLASQRKRTSQAGSNIRYQALLPFKNSTFGRVRETCNLLQLPLQTPHDAESDSGDVADGKEFPIELKSGDDQEEEQKGHVVIRVLKSVVTGIEHSLLVHENTWQVLASDQDQELTELPTKALNAIQEVRSHEQALGQCSNFLSRHLPLTSKEGGKIPMNSTAGAAASLLSDSDSKQGNLVAAIASSICATHSIYPGLRLAKRDIQDRDDNRTTFLLVEIVQ
ncbi:unnamed protein product [Sympodiomycopsis kandeliae]